MPGMTASVALRAELGCSVQEDNWEKGEHYSARWNSGRLISQPQDRQSQWEMDDSHRESLLLRQWGTRTLVQVRPSGVVTLGTVERGVRDPPQALQRVTASPRSAPQESRAGQPAAEAQGELSCFGVPWNSEPSGKGSVKEIAKEPPAVKRSGRGSSGTLRSVGRLVSQETQRG